MVRIVVKSESRYPVSVKSIREKAISILAEHGITQNAELSVLFVGDRKMKLLNKKYLNRDCTTDVLSYTLTENNEKKDGFVYPPDDTLHLGDVVVSYPVARRQAGEKNHTVDQEINILVEHGLLHLLGIHHE